jgi:TetR/AcrR family transcriptional regulator
MPGDPASSGGQGARAAARRDWTGQAGPVQERAQATREKLLEAAIQRFAAVGYEAATTRDIEAAAGVKRGLIAYHYKTKDVLWKAAVTWLFERAAGELEAAERHAADVDAVARLRYFIRAYVRFCARYPAVNRMMVQEGMHDDWRLAWLVEHFVRPWYARVENLLNQARALGAAPSMDVLHFYYILTGGAALIFAMAPEARQLSGLDPASEAVVDAHADALAQLLFPRGAQ